MEGIPANVSAMMLTIDVSLLPRFAYSTSQIAAKTPRGAAIASDISVIITVETSAGVIETFSDVYVREKSCGFICGMPFTKIKPMRYKSTDAVNMAAPQVRIRSAISENFILRLCIIFSL